jgi:arsenate reductase
MQNNSVQTVLFSPLEQIILSIDTDTISAQRKEALHPLIDFIQSKVEKKEDIRINFICSHNSRRSLFSQVWAQTMAKYFSIEKVTCYSGGTEATALYPTVAETLQKTGFDVKKIATGDNPIYSIKYTENDHAIIGFSKILDDDFNPKSQFAAIMTCDSANEACPFVPGAEKRIPITFEDPKAFDDTDQKEQKYMERSLQIASELFYVFSNIKSL